MGKAKLLRASPFSGVIARVFRLLTMLAAVVTLTLVVVTPLEFARADKLSGVHVPCSIARYPLPSQESTCCYDDGVKVSAATFSGVSVQHM
jgi:hypothetical protein